MSYTTALSKAGSVRLLGILAVSFTIAACSSSSNRFTAYNTSQTANNSVKEIPAEPVETGAVVPTQYREPYSRTVDRGTLDQPAAQTVSGDKTVIVAPGQTLYSISREHHVPVSRLVVANRLKMPYQLQAGQTIKIPGRNSTLTAQTTAPRALKPVRTAQQHTIRPASTHRIKRGETLYRVAVNYGVKPTKLARHNNIDAPYTVKAGQVLRIPKAGQPVRVASRSPEPLRSAAVTPQQMKPLRKRQGAPKTNKAKAHKGPLPAPAAMTSDKFRWPVKGRIIARFGAQSTGQRNDGINIAVPVGTSVKAAENGVVAYAGSELRGYGNLVLVRHANNWVTAYSHNSKLLVKRGDKVSRGQIIARAGQTGSVTSPQLHFEIRKGAKAIDPLLHLAPVTVASR